MRTHVNMPDKAQSDIIMGLPGPQRTDPNYMDVSLMNTVLGVFGMMGRIGGASCVLGASSCLPLAGYSLAVDLQTFARLIRPLDSSFRLCLYYYMVE